MTKRFTWTHQDASEARQATTLPTRAWEHVLDPFSPRFRGKAGPAGASLYALRWDDLGNTVRVYVDNRIYPVDPLGSGEYSPDVGIENADKEGEGDGGSQEGAKGQGDPQARDRRSRQGRFTSRRRVSRRGCEHPEGEHAAGSDST